MSDTQGKWSFAKSRVKEETDRLVKALEDRGHKCGSPEDDIFPLRTIDGVYIGIVSFDIEVSSWTHLPTGKLRFKIGSKSYPEPKAGFNLDKCIERILSRKDESTVLNQREVDRMQREADTRLFFDSEGTRLVKLASGLATKNDDRYGRIWIRIKGIDCELNEVDCERISFSVKAKPEVIERIILALKE